MSKTKNLGQVSGVFIGKSAPNNTSIIWYDDTPSQMCHKIYDPVTNSWKALSPDIVSNTTYSELILNAQKNGLSVGKHYVITDKSNVLAIAITATKVQYPDSLGNILIDDLGNNIQYHVSSSNLLIDDLSGVFNIESNKLVFTFQEQLNVNINIETDYLFGKVRSGAKWILSKFRFSSLISSDVNNSISWNYGLFFSFKNSINKILNKRGGVVGYDNYLKKVSQINKDIENVSKDNQEIISNANKNIEDKTKDSEIYNKKIQNNIDVVTAPGDVIMGDSLFIIVSKFQRWINRFKYADGISLSKNFADAKNQQYINNNDTVESAFSKIQYMLKNPTKIGMLPDDWGTGAKKEDGSFFDPSDYSAFQQDGFPIAGDSIFYAFAKIVDFIQKIGEFGHLSSTWKEIEYKEDVNYPIAEDSFDTAFKKLTAKLRQLGEISDGEIKYSNGDYTTIFNIKDGYLSLYNKNGDNSEFSHSRIRFYVKQDNSYNTFFDVDKDTLMYKTSNTFLDSNDVKCSVLFENIGVRNSNSNEDLDVYCAFQASMQSELKNSYDAFFQRLKIGSITLQKIIVTDDYYITPKRGLVVWNGQKYGNLYLPNKPEDGLIISILNGSAFHFNVWAQGGDIINYTDTVGYTDKVLFSQRGLMLTFMYISNFHYEYNITIESGTWKVIKWAYLEDTLNGE